MEEVKECEYYKAYIKSGCKGLGNPKCKVEDCVLKQLQLKDNEIDKLNYIIDKQDKRLAQEYDNFNKAKELIKLKDKMIEKVIKIIENIQQNSPEYDNCYHKDECGKFCTPKIEGKVLFCTYDACEQALAELEKEKV